jgi:hypothetical protein
LWIAAGEQVLLFTDANSDVYRGILATRLASDDIRMTEQCREILGFESPASHSTGSNPITGIFATSGIECKHVLQSAHKAGVGDHHFFVIDVDLSTMIGEDFPQLVRYEGRKLQSKKHKAQKAYNKSLRKNVIQHKLIEKYDSLRLHHHHLTKEEKQSAINKLDNQKTELMYCGENKCRKIMKGPIECSPQVKLWIERRRVFNWILRHKLSPLKDPQNLYRACRVLAKAGGPLSVRQPNEYTVDQVKAQIIAIGEHIQRLQPEAP